MGAQYEGMDWNKVEIWDGPTTSTPLQEHLLFCLTGYWMALNEEKNEGTMSRVSRLLQPGENMGRLQCTSCRNTKYWTQAPKAVKLLPKKELDE